MSRCGTTGAGGADEYSFDCDFSEEDPERIRGAVFRSAQRQLRRPPDSHCGSDAADAGPPPRRARRSERRIPVPRPMAECHRGCLVAIAV